MIIPNKNSGGLNPKNIIPFSDSAFYYAGRWTNNGTGMQSGWNGSYIRFKVKNTSTIKVNAFYDITGTTATSYLTYHLDNDPLKSLFPYFYAGGATASGNASLTIPCINDGNYHDMVLHFGGSITDQFSQASKTTFLSIEIDGGGSIAYVTPGTKLIQFLSDSWAGPVNDYTRLIDRNLYNIYSISSGGGTCAITDANYNYDFNGILNTTDPVADAVCIEFGVNEYGLGTTVAAFQTSLLSLIDKVRIKQPGVKIFLIRVPNNGASLYGQYYTAMVNAAGLRTNIVTIDTSSVDASMDWETDNGHLGYGGKVIFANYIKTQLIANGI